MEINNQTAAVILMFALTITAVTASVLGNTTTGEDSQVVANESNIGNNFDKLNELIIDLSTVESSLTVLSERISDLEGSGTGTHNHNDKAPVSHNHNQYSIQSHSHTTSTTSSGNFDLEICQDRTCRNDSTNFNQGDVLYLTGSHNTNDGNFEFEVRNSDNDFIASGQIGVSPGAFSWQWSIPSDLPDDTYTLSIEIDRDTDEIDFTVR